MQLPARRLRLQHPDRGAADAAGLDFLGGGRPHLAHRQGQAQGQARQRVVAVQHHMLGIDLGHGVQGVLGHALGGGAFGQPIELHAGLDRVREDVACFEEHELRHIVAKSVFWLQVQVTFVAGFLVDQGFLDLGQQVVSADEKFDGVGQFVDQLALGILQTPHQADHAGWVDEHVGMIAQGPAQSRHASPHRPCQLSRPQPCRAFARGAEPAAIHAPPLAEEAPADSPGTARCAATGHPRRAVRAGVTGVCRITPGPKEGRALEPAQGALGTHRAATAQAAGLDAAGAGARSSCAGRLCADVALSLHPRCAAG